MILVTGASGTVGSAVLDEVRKSGQPFRAMYRSDKEARKAAGVSTVIADFADKESLKRALSGVDAVFLVCAADPSARGPGKQCDRRLPPNGRQAPGPQFRSCAGDYPKSFPSWHRAVEDKLKASGLGYTILRPNTFMQNIVAYNAPSIREQGAFYSSTGNARISYLDVRDIAAVAVKAQLSPRDHAGKTYELNGPEAVSNAELADRISRIAGRTVKYVDIPEAAQRKGMSDSGMPEWQVNALLELQQYYKGGKGGAVTDVLPRLLGRPPIMLDQFLEEFKDSFQPQAVSV